jgi:hypothetical protein
MTPQELIAALEQYRTVKQAGGGVGALVPKVVRTTRVPRPAGPGLFQRSLNAVQDGVGIAADESLTALDNLGRVTRDRAGKAMEAGKNFVEGFRGKPDTTYKPRLTNHNPNERGLIPYSAPEPRGLKPYKGELRNYTPPGRTWGNIGTGLGVTGAATYGLTAAHQGIRDMFGKPAPAPAYMPQQQPQGGPGLMDMWQSLPIEARYAIGAGVPLALLGAYAGGNGNSGLGMGMGAAGLGLAGLGAAHGGLFGQGAQQGVQGLMNMLSGRGQDPHYHAYLQHQLQDQIGSNSVSSGMVKKQSARDFGAYIEKLSAGRCWEGYEPVPGKAPYSNDSCRPKGKKKKKTEEKTAAKDCGCTTMSATPSSRGTTKKVNNEQKSTNSPQPEDVGETQKVSHAFLWALRLGYAANA